MAEQRLRDPHLVPSIAGGENPMPLVFPNPVGGGADTGHQLSKGSQKESGITPRDQRETRGYREGLDEKKRSAQGGDTVVVGAVAQD